MRASSPYATSVAEELSGLLDDFQVPLPTHAIRVLMADRGRPVTAERLGSLAADERKRFLRSLLPPRLSSALDPAGYAATPRWWARGGWRLRRRILTADAREQWLAVLAERLCTDLASRSDQPDELVTLALGTATQLGAPVGPTFELPLTPAGWVDLRSAIVQRHPAALHSIEGPTREQQDAEERLAATSPPAVDLYFGRPR